METFGAWHWPLQCLLYLCSESVSFSSPRDGAAGERRDTTQTLWASKNKSHFTRQDPERVPDSSLANSARPIIGVGWVGRGNGDPQVLRTSLSLGV